MCLKKVEIWTDGACLGNPGVGGIGIILKYKNNIKEINGYVENVTNNKMELLAVIVALNSLIKKCDVILYSDSKYMKDGITKWINTWKTNNWKTANKQPVKNKLLWEELDRLVNFHNIDFTWIKGHSGIENNERVDFLCQEAIRNKINIDCKYLHLL